MKNHNTVLQVGMMFLLVALLAQYFMHPTRAIGPDMTDGVKGMLFGLAIGFNLLAVRLRCKAVR